MVLLILGRFLVFVGHKMNLNKWSTKEGWPKALAISSVWGGGYWLMPYMYAPQGAPETNHPLTPGTFLKKTHFWTFWTFSAWI